MEGQERVDSCWTSGLIFPTVDCAALGTLFTIRLLVYKIYMVEKQTEKSSSFLEVLKLHLKLEISCLQPIHLSKVQMRENSRCWHSLGRGHLHQPQWSWGWEPLGNTWEYPVCQAPSRPAPHTYTAQPCTALPYPVEGASVLVQGKVQRCA